MDEYKVYVEQAADLLVKTAAENGIDLDGLSAEELSQMITEGAVQLAKEAAGVVEDVEGDASGAPEGGAVDPTAKVAANGLLISDDLVSAALSKQAADNQFDLAQLNPEQYKQAFDTMRDYLGSPEFLDQYNAEVEKVARLEEAKVAGQVMAEAFYEQLNKLSAAEHAEPDGDEEPDHESKEKEKEKEAGVHVPRPNRSVASRLGEAARSTMHNAVTAKNTVKDRASDAARSVKSHAGAAANTASDVARTHPKATGAALGAAAAGAAGAGAAAAMRKKEATLKMASLRAQELYALETGCHPESGEKFASDAELVDYLAHLQLAAAQV